MVTLKPGWLFDYATGTLAVDPSKRSAFAAATVRGGVVNAPARDILPRFGIPILPTYAASIPLHENHDMMQGTTSVDCIHYCAPGMGGANMRITVQPRLQVESWSLYWKESMDTKTQVLDPLTDLELPAGATAADLARAAAERLGWRPAGKLLRLEGFSGPWDRCLLNGRLLGEGEALEEAGVKEGDAVTYVRVELMAEGWK
ncbi:hypothetical protein MNEG_6896, partial [Monoraphidium neglectum]